MVAPPDVASTVQEAGNRHPLADKRIKPLESIHLSSEAKVVATRILRDGLGKAELEVVTSHVAPLYWLKRPRGPIEIRNGSIFFIDAGLGPFAVTAAHVIAGWREDNLKFGATPPCIAGDQRLLHFDIDQRIIDDDSEIDITTFQITREEVALLGKVILTGVQRTWPPAPPNKYRGVLISGYPSTGTIVEGPSEVCFGAAPAGLIAHSVSEIDVSCQLERTELIGILGSGLPPENFNFGGMSGGPMLTIVEKALGPNSFLRSYALAGVIHQGPNPALDHSTSIEGLEVIRARRARFINSDGTLNRVLWHEVNFGRH